MVHRHWVAFFRYDMTMMMSSTPCPSSHQRSNPVKQDNFDEAEGIRSVHAAFQAGINLFDTSPYYGSLRSEQVC